MAKNIIVDRPEYIFYEEQFDNRTWIHLDVFRWNKRTRKEICRWVYVIANYYGEVYTIHFKDDVKHKKFLKLIGGQYFSENKDYEGRETEIWIKKGTVNCGD